MSVLTEEYKRLITALRITELGSDKYLRLLEAIEKINRLIPEEKQEEESPVEIKSSSFPEEIIEPKTSTVIEPAVNYTKEDIREFLTEASKQGIKIQPIMQQFIPEGQAAKLSNIPVTSYGALVEAVNNAR